MMPIYRGALALALLLSALPAAADPHPNNQGGVDVNQVLQVGNLDNINLFNGALTVTIPLGISYPDGGKMSYRFAPGSELEPLGLLDQVDHQYHL